MTGSTQQSGPSEIGLETIFWWLLDTHMWRGLDENAPVAETELPGYPPLKRRRILAALIDSRTLKKRCALVACAEIQ